MAQGSISVHVPSLDRFSTAFNQPMFWLYPPITISIEIHFGASAYYNFPIDILTDEETKVCYVQ